MPQYRVHIYAVVNIPVEVTAQSPTEAAAQAYDQFDIGQAIIDGQAHYADDVQDFLVDRLDDQGETVESTDVAFDDMEAVRHLASENELPPSCECDNTHEANNTVCRWCWHHGHRHWNDPEVPIEE